MRIAIVAVVMTVALAGCSGSDGSAVKPLVTDSPSATASETPGDPVAPAAVKPTRPDDVNSGLGAKAYSIFVMQNVVYAISTNDTEPLLGLSNGASCDTCVSLAKANQKRGDLAQVPTADTAITSIEVERQSGKRYVVRQVLAFPKVETKNLKTGEVTETDAPSEVPITAVVVWKSGEWKLDDYGTKEV